MDKKKEKDIEKEEELVQEETDQPLVDEQEESKENFEEEIEKLKDQHLRLLAEYDNYRKRTLKEKSDLLKYGGEKVVVAFLDVMDDLDLALANIQKAESLEGVVEGVELIISKFKQTLKSQEVSEIEVIGLPFDPEVHDAVAMLPTEDKEMKGKVLDCVQKGYQLADKVIRHPKVVVGQ